MHLYIYIAAAFLLVSVIYILYAYYKSVLAIKKLRRMGYKADRKSIVINASPDALEYALRLALQATDFGAGCINVIIKLSSPDKDEMLYISNRFLEKYGRIKIILI